MNTESILAIIGGLLLVLVATSLLTVVRKNGFSQQQDAISRAWTELSDDQKALIDLYRTAFEIRGQQLIDAGILPAPLYVARETSDLRTSLESKFTVDEMSSIAYDIGVGSEISGDTPSIYARNMIRVADRRGKLELLKQAVNKARS